MIEARPLPWFDQSRTDIRVDLNFGEFTYSPRCDQWGNRWTIGTHAEIMVYGSGQHPTDEQLKTWQTVMGQFSHFELIAAAEIPPPPADGKIETRFSTDTLSLREIWLSDAFGAFSFAFDSPVSDLLRLWPIVDFKNSKVALVEWSE